MMVLTQTRNPFRDPHLILSELPYYALPFTGAMYLAGRAAAFEVLYVGLINFGAGACAATAYLFLAGMRSALTGRTPHEESKVARAKEADRAALVRRWDDEDYGRDGGGGGGEGEDYAKHFREVFGPHGWMHFFVPWLPFEGTPEAELGYRRLIVYNNDYVHEGTIKTADVSLDFQP